MHGYEEVDVKEFIKKVKQEIKDLRLFSERNFKIVLPQKIGRLAGEKLTDGGLQ